MTATARKQPRRKFFSPQQRLVLLAALLAFVYFGGEMLEPLLEEGTHLLLEALEMLIEEFYEHVLHLPRREAEIFTVWSGSLLALLLLFFIVRAIIRRIVHAYVVTRHWCLSTLAALDAWRRTWSEADIAILVAASAVIVITLITLFF